MIEPIQVWRFKDAPAVFQILSTNGGDEDWLALVPEHMSETWIPWLDSSSFGACDITDYKLPDGRLVVIGAHA